MKIRNHSFIFLGSLIVAQSSTFCAWDRQCSGDRIEQFLTACVAAKVLDAGERSVMLSKAGVMADVLPQDDWQSIMAPSFSKSRARQVLNSIRHHTKRESALRFSAQ